MTTVRFAWLLAAILMVSADAHAQKPKTGPWDVPAIQKVEVKPD